MLDKRPLNGSLLWLRFMTIVVFVTESSWCRSKAWYIYMHLTKLPFWERFFCNCRKCHVRSLHSLPFSLLLLIAMMHRAAAASSLCEQSRRRFATNCVCCWLCPVAVTNWPVTVLSVWRSVHTTSRFIWPHHNWPYFHLNWVALIAPRSNPVCRGCSQSQQSRSCLIGHSRGELGHTAHPLPLSHSQFGWNEVRWDRWYERSLTLFFIVNNNPAG